MAQRRRSTRRQTERAKRSEQEALQEPSSRRRRASTAVRTIPKPFLVIGSIFLVAVIVLVLVNYWVSVKRPADEPFLEVNDTVFTWNDYVGRLRFIKLGTEVLGGRFDGGTEPYKLINIMAENELILQASAREGLSVTDEEIRQEMISRLVDKADEIDDPKQIDRELRVRLNNYLASVQFSSGDYRRLVENDLLREQLRQNVGSPLLLPRVQPQVFLHIILPDDQQVAEVQDRLAEGEEFASIARRLSSDKDTRADGGERGWVPRLVFKDFDTMLFGLREGQVSDPLRTEDGYYLVKLVERVGDKAHLQAILVEDLPTARQVVGRFDSGLTFEELSVQHSIDPDLRASRGDLGQVGIGDHGGIFDELIRGIPLGEIGGPLGSLEGTYFLKVTDRTEAREVHEDDLDILKTRALDDWLNRERDRSQVNFCPGDSCFGSVKVDRALKEIRDLALTKSQLAATAAKQEADRQRR